ncbi:hypothetical protein [Chryseobacterium sp. SIMBA_038]|uniref:hypothetical protein n=1 Tax=Chryseobacterium sp. SIMBA_038 TaxID=3085780 RepID=UPI00397CA24F
MNTSITNPTKIIIVHDDMDEDYPLIIMLKAKYLEENVLLFKHSQEGLAYILDNLGQKMVVLLDKNFKDVNDISGLEVFEKIREKTSLIYVVLISANSISEFSEDELKMLINRDLFKLETFTSDSSRIISLVDDAVLNTSLRVDAVIEEWIMRHPIEKRTQIMLKTKEGQNYTMNDILESIRKQTEIGLDFEKSLLKLAIELFSRQKLLLND